MFCWFVIKNVLKIDKTITFLFNYKVGKDKGSIVFQILCEVSILPV